jgi:hypothetical protein
MLYNEINDQMIMMVQDPSSPGGDVAPDLLKHDTLVLFIQFSFNACGVGISSLFDYARGGGGNKIFTYGNYHCPKIYPFVNINIPVADVPIYSIGRFHSENWDEKVRVLPCFSPTLQISENAAPYFLFVQ